MTLNVGGSFDAAAREALATWSAVGSSFRFSAASASDDPSCLGATGLNVVSWSDGSCSVSLGERTLAITYSSSDETGRTLKSDVIFNADWRWSVYSGPIRSDAFDFRRVALHEFGHVLGLAHPDDHGQSVTALMNGVIHDVDTLQQDDINGALCTYGSPDCPPSPHAPPPRPPPPSRCTLEDLGTVAGKVKHTGSLDSDCVSPNRSGQYARYYGFTLERAAPVQIDLTSSALDMWLALREGASISAPLLETDDDGGPGTDARIGRELAAGTYVIEASSYEAGVTGPFALSIAVAYADADRAVLEAFHDAVGGAGWTNRTNWKTPAPLVNWHGVTTDADGRVTALSLPGNGLTGTIPPALGELDLLRELDLGSRWDSTSRLSIRNGLTGPIPAELGSLVNLERLDLAGNDLTGPVPPWLENLSGLRVLDLGGTGLTGPIPKSLDSLTLERLDVSHAWGLSGPLPSGLSGSSLTALDIFATRTCAPAVLEDWLETIEFSGRRCETGPDVELDVAVLYTPVARDAAGGAAAIEAVIDLMIAEANQAYATSGVDIRLALAARLETPYEESGDAYLDLDRLAKPSDGHLDEVHDLRGRVGADLVHLIVGAEGTDVSGIANLAGAFGLSTHAGGGMVFTHELGHNLGLYHDRYQVHHREGGVSPHPAYGYVNPRAFRDGAPTSSRWRTLMSLDTRCEDEADASCSWLPRFSNAGQHYGGDRLGVSFGAGGSGVDGPADAAAVLAVTAPAVAAWRDRPPGANRAPAAVGTLPDRTLLLDGTLEVDVSQAFVDPDGDALLYRASSTAPEVAAVRVSGTRVTLTAVGVGAAVIRVTATDSYGVPAAQSFPVKVIEPFTDDPIVPGVTPIRAIHFMELRTRIDAVRDAAGLGRLPWTDPVLTAGVTQIRIAHLLELREALAGAYEASGRSAPDWTDAAPEAGTTLVRTVHLLELREAVIELE